MAFASHDGPFVSWYFCDAGEAPGFVNFLAGALDPVLQDLALACDLVFDRSAPAVQCPLPLGTKVAKSAFYADADAN